MPKFQGVDYYQIDDLLSDEEKLVRNTVREFVDERILPIIEKHNREGTFPRDLVPAMADLGLFGATLPPVYGCAGLNNVAYGLMTQELERGDSSIRSFASVQSSLVMYPIYAFGSEDQKNRWLPLLSSGKAIGCFGLTEPDFGSNPGGMITRAVPSNGGYLLNGAKMWITNGTIADVAVVWAKLDSEIKGFLVEKGTKGFTAPEMTGKHSLRASVTSELVFQDCWIPKENILPERHPGEERLPAGGGVRDRAGHADGRTCGTAVDRRAGRVAGPGAVPALPSDRLGLPGRAGGDARDQCQAVLPGPRVYGAFAAGAVGFEAVRRSTAGTVVRALMVLLVGISGAVSLPFAKPVLSTDAFLRYSAALGIGPRSEERQELGRLPQQYADMHGWQELASNPLAKVYHALPPADRERACRWNTC